MTLESRDKRFGVVAVEKGFINKEQLFEALRVQTEENLEQNTHRLTGVILYELGYITKEQIEEILEFMRKQGKD
jgi:predicted nucleotide-binding protein (sugar kinase/HSP70/actin superfamily)